MVGQKRNKKLNVTLHRRGWNTLASDQNNHQFTTSCPRYSFEIFLLKTRLFVLRVIIGYLKFFYQLLLYTDDDEIPWFRFTIHEN